MDKGSGSPRLVVDRVGFDTCVAPGLACDAAMTKGALDLTPLRRAVASLDTALAKPKDEFVRDSVIQRFEYTYELSWKLLKRHLEWDEGASTIDQLTRKQLYRLAAEKGLIGAVEDWFAYHRARNNTSHAYNEATAEEVYETARRFSPEVHRLIAALESREND